MSRSNAKSGDTGTASKSDGVVRALPAEIAAATVGMNAEDAAAYVKVQLGTADPNLTAERARKAAKPKRPAQKMTKSASPDSKRPAPRRAKTVKKPAPPARSVSDANRGGRVERTPKEPSASAAADGAFGGAAPQKQGRPRRTKKKVVDTPAPEAKAPTPPRAAEPQARRRPAPATEARTPREPSPAPKPTTPSAPAPKAAVEHRGIDGMKPKLGAGRVMVINNVGDDECRIAVLFEKKLEEFFIERSSSVSHVGNIYKGVITNVESSIQAAFIDFGLPKQGFLHISDVQPQYFGGSTQEPEGVGRKVPRRDRPPIQKCFKRGQEVIVQVIKEGLGTKGPTLSTYLSIPGRYIVMMPGMTRLGVSRKIEDEESRRKMRSVLSELTLPKDMGFILRTAGEDRTKRDLQRDLTYLDRLWKLVVKRVRSAKAPAALYRESDLVTRTIRDVFTVDFDGIITDNETTAKLAREFLRIALPRTSEDVVAVYGGRDPIFHAYGIEEQIDSIHARQVPLKSGGSIVIDQTEALVAIDVNSGRLRSADGEEETAFQTNIEAAREIARQLRLRDLGGLVVCDFIDMRFDRHKRAVERELRDDLKKHKERARLLRMSQFGLIELTRQRQGPSIKRGIYSDCPHCKGSGLVKTPESMTLHVLRNIQKAVHLVNVLKLTVIVSADVANELQNRKRSVIHEFETETGKRIYIRADSAFTWDQQEYETEDKNGRRSKLYVDAN